MLTGIHIEDFRCIRSVDVPIRPLTVLIGPNDTGKSTLLEALWRLDARNGAAAVDGWRALSVPYLYGRGPREVERGRTYRGGLRVAQYQLPVRGPAMRSEGSSTEVPTLDQDGGRVPTVLDWMLRKDRARFDRLVKTVLEQVPGLEDLGIDTPSASTREVLLKLDEGYWLPAASASAGVRLLLFYLTLAHHPEPPELVLLEEPENGLHPHRLAYVMEILRGLTEGAFGARPVQVVLSTHSPHLLDHVDPAKDQVLVFKRLPDGSRTAEPADAARLATFLDEFKLGEVWFNQREEGLVARPGGA